MEFMWALRNSSLNPHHWALFLAIQALNSSPEATNSVRSQGKDWEEERERKEGSQREIREQEGKFTSENPNQRIRGTDQNLRITNSGNSQTSSNHVEEPFQNLKRCESVERSNCPIQNPNPNTKQFERNQRNISKSTTSVNRSEYALYRNVFTKKKTKNVNSSNLNHQDPKIHVVWTANPDFFRMICV